LKLVENRRDELGGWFRIMQQNGDVMGYSSASVPWINSSRTLQTDGGVTRKRELNFSTEIFFDMTS